MSTQFYFESALVGSLSTFGVGPDRTVPLHNKRNVRFFQDLTIWSRIYSEDIRKWMQLVHLQSNERPCRRQARLGDIGLCSHVFTGHVSELLTGSYSCHGGLSPYDIWQWQIPNIENMEGMFASAVCQLTDMHPLLFTVQLWLVAATRLGFASYMKPVLNAYDVLFNAAEWNMGCVESADLLSMYMEKAERHIKLEEARISLTRSVLIARSHHLGVDRADMFSCGMHPPNECPAQERSDCSDDDRLRLDPVLNLVRPATRPSTNQLNFFIPVIW